MCSDSYPIPVLSLFFLYHPYILYFLIQRIFHFLVKVAVYHVPFSKQLLITDLVFTQSFNLTACILSNLYSYNFYSLQSLNVVETYIHTKFLCKVMGVESEERGGDKFCPP